MRRLNTEKERKTQATAELERLSTRMPTEHAKSAQLEEALRARLAKLQLVLTRQAAHARPLLRRLLLGKIEMEPYIREGVRGYHFRGETCDRSPA